jgi:hypothetical protein
MQTNARLKPTEELDELEVARRVVAAVDARLAERRLKLQQLEASRAEVQTKVHATARDGDVGALGRLSSDSADAADAARALSGAIAGLEAERSEAHARIQGIAQARRLQELAARVGPEREGMRVARSAIEDTLNGTLAALEEHSRRCRDFSSLRGELEYAGAPIGPELSTREVLAALGCGRGQAFRLGVERVEIPVPITSMMA